jgi:exonuclease SbcC
MRFQHIKLRGLGPFRSVDLDVESLPGRLVAVTGENGAGKSTLLELLAGALLRECPTRGSLRELATERDAYVEVQVVNGRAWTVRQTVDAVSGKGEALILDDEGRPVLDDGKVSSADRWIAEHFAPPETLFASTFAVQGREGFVAMKPAERKAVLLRLLGVERLEVLADGARARARDARQKLAVVEARAADERGRAGDANSIRGELERARLCVSERAKSLTLARDELERAQEERGREARRDELVGRLRELARRRGALRETIAGGGAVRRAADALPGLRDELSTAESNVRDLEAQTKEAHAELKRLRAEWERARADAAAAVERLNTEAPLLLERTKVEEAVVALPGAREELAATVKELEGIERQFEEYRSQHVDSAEDRVGALRGALAAIIDTPHLAAETARGALDDDHLRAERAATLPLLQQKARDRVAALRSGVRSGEDRVRALDRLAARAPEMERIEASCREHERARDAARAEAERLRGEGEVAATRERTALDAQAAADLALGPQRTRLRALERLASRAPGLVTAEAQLAEVEAGEDAAERELAAIPEIDEALLRTDWRRKVEELEQALRADERAVARAEQQLATAEAGAVRIAELDAERRTIEGDLADWNVLARDLGRDGVQAALIDAAGPELTALANSYLHRAYGSRWTIVLETTRASADGKRQLEGLDVRVIDTERGRDAAIETYSGGERVILGEAVALALTTLACRRNGITEPTLIRDESGAALSAENARAYIAMLRHAIELTGARHCLLVSHSPEVQELADCRVIVRDGGVEVVS